MGLNSSQSLAKMGSMRSETVDDMQSAFNFIQHYDALRMQAEAEDSGVERRPEQERKLDEMMAATMHKAAFKLHAIHMVQDDIDGLTESIPDVA